MRRGNKTTKRSGNPIDQHVGARMKMQRVALNMTQTALAEKLGITFQQVQKYEKGTNRIGAGRLQRIADVLKVPIAFFFEGVPGGTTGKPDKSAASLMDFLSTSDGLALMKAYMGVKDMGVRSQIVRLVQTIAEEEGN